jgi:hypothetical protein
MSLISARCFSTSTSSAGPYQSSMIGSTDSHTALGTVDVENATWTNTIGAPELITVWKAPDFDPALSALQ